ncbi:hypothetical protein [Lactococcus phage Nocturne116]|nr:hypothetical protein [Lactococcus phage Nocturne116]
MAYYKQYRTYKDFEADGIDWEYDDACDYNIEQEFKKGYPVLIERRKTAPEFQHIIRNGRGQVEFSVNDINGVYLGIVRGDMLV